MQVLECRCKLVYEKQVLECRCKLVYEKNLTLPRECTSKVLALCSHWARIAIRLTLCTENLSKVKTLRSII